MSKQVIMYDEAHDEVRFAQVSDDTFVLCEGSDKEYRSMTYGEWEALRCQQACDAAKNRGASRDVSRADLQLS